MTEITYALEPQLDPQEFADVLRRSTLGERRPVDDAEAMRGMVAHADLTGAGLADLDVDDLQFLGTAGAVDADGFAHG